MRKRSWPAAAFVTMLSAAVVLLVAPRVQAADTVTMGSDAEPYALKFFPDTITIPVGTTVKWVNKGDLQHDAVAENGAFESPLLNKGQTFEFKFTSPGEFAYFCTPHKDAGMKGVVKVTGAAGPAPAPAAPTTTTRPKAAAGPPTTTTTKAAPAPRAAKATTTTTAARTADAPPASTTTTTAGEAPAGVTTSSAPATTPTSPPEVEEAATGPADQTQAGEEALGDDHASAPGGAEGGDESSPLGIAFAGISTLILIGISGKLLVGGS